MNAIRLYSIGTFDTNTQSFSPQESVPAFNLTRNELVASMRMLQDRGYPCHRYGNSSTDDIRDSDWSVLIERTDGKSESEILKGWER